MKYFLNQRLFQEKRQPILGEKLDKPRDLEKSYKTGRLPAAEGDFTGLHCRNLFKKGGGKLENTCEKNNVTQKQKEKLNYYLSYAVHIFLSFKNFFNTLSSACQENMLKYWFRQNAILLGIYLLKKNISHLQ